jgi:GNAT superfamily N-acetyltransferase
MTARVPLDVRLEGLGAPVDERFGLMTFPAYRHLLSLSPARRHPEDSNRPIVTPVALGAFVNREPAALALAEIPTGQAASAEVLSVFVAPEFRRRGLATALLGALGTYLARMGVEKASCVYMTGQESQAAVERVLEKAGWDKPETRQLILRFTLEQARRTAWFDKYPLDPGTSVFPWITLTAEELEALKESQRATGWIKPDLEPWKHDHVPVEPLSSLGIRLHGNLVGWVLNHAVSDRVVRFTCSFIRRDLGRRGKIVPAYSESIRRLSEGTAFEECSLTVPVRHLGMSSFVVRRCAPYASFLGETRGSCRRLSLDD